MSHGGAGAKRPWDDPRIAGGMSRQLSHRRQRLQAGEKPLGWKMAFGGPAAMQRLGIDEALVGFLLQSAILPSGSKISLSGWTKPIAEPELAVHLGKDLAPGSDRETTVAAIAGLGPAIELADVDHPSEDVEGTLARNIYQRHVVLGPCDTNYAGGRRAGLHALVHRNHEEIANTADLEALTGELIHVVQHAADMLAAFQEKVCAGHVIIAGSITPPISVQPGDEIIFQLSPLVPISVAFTNARRGANL